MFEVKPKLTPENILEQVDQYLIFKYYCPGFKEIDKHFHSELRKDPIPSAVITYYNNRLWYKDFGAKHKGVDCFGYVMLKYGVNFYQALGIINLDFNLGLESSLKLKPSLNYIGLPDTKIPDYTKDSHTDIIIKPIFREWIIQDKEYWLDWYGITKETLELFNVSPVTGFKLLYVSSNKTLNEKLILKDKITYSYLLYKKYKSIDRYKIYSPLEEKHKKWITNCDETILQGLDQLPLHGDTLVITKSLKDVMVLYEFGISSIAPQSESSDIEYSKIKMFRNRFINTTLLFDNDTGGCFGSKKLSEKYSLTENFIPEEYLINYGIKDISDFRKKFGYEKTKDLLTNYFKFIN